MARNWHKAHKDGLTAGELAADALRNGMGSWAFIISILLAMVGWILTLGFGIDNAQLTILNLVLSCMAALQGSIILISAKRMDTISAAMAQHDYETNLASKKELDDVKEILANQDMILAELRELLGARA